MMVTDWFLDNVMNKIDFPERIPKGILWFIPRLLAWVITLPLLFVCLFIFVLCFFLDFIIHIIVGGNL